MENNKNVRAAQRAILEIVAEGGPRTRNLLNATCRRYGDPDAAALAGLLKRGALVAIGATKGTVYGLPSQAGLAKKAA